ncbi:MAG TPA: MOFRL family protein, partial [Burkholderiales bacterium]|nr:MOFRL family protein [Burkholderiales bacterium]
ETTVQLPPQPGRGGRNQSLALSAARVLRDRKSAWFLAAGTDGSDGPTEDAGALVDGATVARGKAHGLDADAALAKADAGTFLEASGDLVHTGPTGTNVMDLMLGLKIE